MNYYPTIIYIFDTDNPLPNQPYCRHNELISRVFGANLFLFRIFFIIFAKILTH